MALALLPRAGLVEVEVPVALVGLMVVLQRKPSLKWAPPALKLPAAALLSLWPPRLLLLLAVLQVLQVRMWANGELSLAREAAMLVVLEL